LITRRGFDLGAQRDTSGLRNMEDRIDALDGSVNVVSAPARGLSSSDQCR